MEPKTGKRIVSKGAYTTILGRKVTLGSLGIFACLSAGVLVALALICILCISKDVVLLSSGYALPDYEALGIVLCASTLR